MPPPVDCAVTVPVSTPPVVVGGNGSSTVSTEPGTVGVVAPHAGVKTAVPSPVGVLFTETGRRLPSPCQ